MLGTLNESGYYLTEMRLQMSPNVLVKERS